MAPAFALTITDEAGRTIELEKPIERAAVIGNYNVDIVAAIGARDTIVGVTGRDLKQYQIAGGKWDESYNVGEWGQVNYEAIVQTNPDAVISYANAGWEELERQLKPFGIPVIVASGWRNDRFDQNVELFGAAFGKQDGAKRVLEFRKNIYDQISKRVSGQTPRTVYYENEIAYQTPTKGSGFYEAIVKGGGRSIFDDVVFGEGGHTQGTVWKTPIDAGEILTRDPDIIIREFGNNYSGSGDDVFDGERRELLARPGWPNLAAARDNKVFIVNAYHLGQQAKTLTSLYVAAWLYPKAFEDFRPEDVARQWDEEFLGIPYKGDEGVYFVRAGSVAQ
ncbi:ABC transporter substrate-binding protein [Agrobacterium vitis]|uniref:ABC transporter substrate-binding protein n=1 Tax=Agrobacterium vitis TaxID=373 RepID=UPI002E370E0D|nr:ABC transporter substrate-binding protein [Agrobacterium vitis]